MSTHATYQFIDTEQARLTTTVYVHHDGYPDGAAGYFYRALDGGKGNAATRFIRANPGAEIMEASAEYRYTLTGSLDDGQLVAEKARSDGAWIQFFKGQVRDFIADNQGLQKMPVVAMTYSFPQRTRLLTPEAAIREWKQLAATLAGWKAQGQEDIQSNVASAIKQLATLKDAIVEATGDGLFPYRDEE